MKSTIFFKGENGGFYLYDSVNKYLLNSHPIIEKISSIESQDAEFVKNQTMDMYPEVSENDFEFHYQKYLFLKNSGFFSTIDSKELLSGKVTPDIIEKQISNLGYIVFQVTNDCNLKCKYCCFGDLYNGIPVKHKKMDFDLVKNVFDYLIPIWNSKKNPSHKNTIGIAFYGGEPLLNFKLIRQIVSYCERLELDNNTSFAYSMTTNATLLLNYIDYLIDYNFNLLVSLDGDEVHDSYRVDRNNNPTFNTVFNNLKIIQKQYPEYFDKNIYINSVLTNKATVEDIHNFIYLNFSKIPLIDPVSTTDLKESELISFNQISQKYIEGIDLTKERGLFSTVGKELSRFFYYNLNNSYRHYGELMTENDTTLYKRIPTGTCLPFANKMYISSTGNIMTCEKIAMTHIIGYVNSKGVSIDFEKIANDYNQYFDNLRGFCQKCYGANTCAICVFQTKFFNGQPQCPHIISEENFQFYLSRIIKVLEEDPNLFFEFNNTVFS